MCHVLSYCSLLLLLYCFWFCSPKIPTWFQMLQSWRVFGVPLFHVNRFVQYLLKHTQHGQVKWLVVHTQCIRFYFDSNCKISAPFRNITWKQREREKKYNLFRRFCLDLLYSDNLFCVWSLPRPHSLFTVMFFFSASLFWRDRFSSWSFQNFVLFRRMKRSTIQNALTNILVLVLVRSHRAVEKVTWKNCLCFEILNV